MPRSLKLRGRRPPRAPTPSVVTLRPPGEPVNRLIWRKGLPTLLAAVLLASLHTDLRVFEHTVLLVSIRAHKAKGPTRFHAEHCRASTVAESEFLRGSSSPDGPRRTALR